MGLYIQICGEKGERITLLVCISRRMSFIEKAQDLFLSLNAGPKTRGLDENEAAEMKIELVFFKSTNSGLRKEPPPGVCVYACCRFAD
jgi:hypothetical protein